MSRNEFEAGHFCTSVEKQVSFHVLIGTLPVCPKCQKIIDTTQPLFSLEVTDKTGSKKEQGKDI